MQYMVSGFLVSGVSFSYFTVPKTRRLTSRQMFRHSTLEDNVLTSASNDCVFSLFCFFACFFCEYFYRYVN